MSAQFFRPNCAVGAVNKEIVVSEKAWFVQVHSSVFSETRRSPRDARSASLSAVLLTRWLSI